MIPFGTETITLYNRREVRDAITQRTTVSWVRTALTGCSWARRMERVRDGPTVTSAEVITCRIPESTAYRTPSAWDALTVTTGLFTLAPGDIIVRGTVTDTITASAALVDKYRRQGVMTVQTTQDNTRPLFRTGHYCARGA